MHPTQEMEAQGSHSLRFPTVMMTVYQSSHTWMTRERVSPNQKRAIGLEGKEGQSALMRAAVEFQETVMASLPSLPGLLIIQTCSRKESLRDHWIKTWLKLGIKFQHPWQEVRPKTHNLCIMIREQSLKKICFKETGKTAALTVEMSLNLTQSQLPKRYKMIIKVIIIINRKWIKELISHHHKTIMHGELEIIKKVKDLMSFMARN